MHCMVITYTTSEYVICFVQLEILFSVLCCKSCAENAKPVSSILTRACLVLFDVAQASHRGYCTRGIQVYWWIVWVAAMALYP